MGERKGELSWLIKFEGGKKERKKVCGGNLVIGDTRVRGSTSAEAVFEPSTLQIDTSA